MVFVQLTSAFLGALLVVGSAIALRHGEVRGAGLCVRRGERLFLPLVAFLAISGFAFGGLAAYIAVGGPLEPVLVRGARYSIVVPPGWQRLEAVEVEAPPGALALGDGESELVVMETEVPLTTGGRVGSVLARRRDAIPLGDEPVSQRELDSVLELSWAYSSPRGRVAARALGYVDDEGRMGWITATCSHGGEPASCERAIDSIEVTAPDRLPLSATAP